MNNNQSSTVNINTHTPSSKGEIREKKISKDNFFNTERLPIYIVLDSLKCAHNIGTILRLSDALLVKKVFICGDTIIPPNKKIKSSSRGAEKWVPWEYSDDIVSVLIKLKEEGVFIMSAEVSKDSIDYDKATYKLPLAIVLGREYDGVSDEALNLSDCIVHLPMYGMCNSINVSTTASVLMYEAHKKMGSTSP
jgi:tRNA G18 (ribose-2'-O)-methylase SpoU